MKLIRILILASVVVLAAASSPAANCRVEMLDATTREGELLEISPDAVKIQTSDAKLELAVKDVLSITLREAPHAKNSSERFDVVTGPLGTLRANSLAFDGKTFSFTNPLLGELELPMADVRRVGLGVSENSDGGFAASPALAGADKLLVRQKTSETVELEGVLKTIDRENIVFAWKDQDRTTQRKSVAGIVLAQGAQEPAPRAAAVSDSSGSSVNFSTISYDGTAFTIEHPACGKRTIESRLVSLVTFDCGRATQLADLKPASADEHGFFDKVFAHRLNKSARGGPISLDGRTYPTGLGLHSYCELTYDLEGKYQQFVCLAGIDDASRPNGDADLVVEGDEKNLARLELKGTDKSQQLRIDVRGVKKFTIRVGFGSDKIDVGDQVDLASARLIAPATK